MSHDGTLGDETPSPSGAVRVVLVDADDDYRDAIKAVLTEDGFFVRSFRDGRSMLAAAAKGLQADVAIFDWGLKKVLGIDLILQMRSRGVLWPVVILTERNSPTHECLALRRGASDFVDKARGSAVLAARLRLIGSRRSTNELSDEVLHCGRLVLRPATSRAFWDDLDVGLTLTEFKMVQLLASNVESFITYRRLYDCMHSIGFVAGKGDDGYRTNVRSAVKRIRNKFKVIHAQFDSIRTYTSFGYCWRKPSE
jgi:two-component system response regulator ChvI